MSKWKGSKVWLQESCSWQDLNVYLLYWCVYSEKNIQMPIDYTWADMLYSDFLPFHTILHVLNDSLEIFSFLQVNVVPLVHCKINLILKIRDQIKHLFISLWNKIITFALGSRSSCRFGTLVHDLNSLCHRNFKRCTFCDDTGAKETNCYVQDGLYKPVKQLT